MRGRHSSPKCTAMMGEATERSRFLPADIVLLAKYRKEMQVRKELQGLAL